MYQQVEHDTAHPKHTWWKYIGFEMQGVMTVTVMSLINGETRPGAGGDTATTTSTPEVRDLSKTLKDVGDSY